MKASDLVKKHCKPCEKGTAPMNSVLVSETLKGLPGWVTNG